jgi:PAS domain S-box-containing protein
MDPASTAPDTTPAAAASAPAGAPFSFDPRTLVPEPLFCCDADGWIVWLNQAAEELTGHGAHALVGYAFPALFPTADRSRLFRFFARRHLRGEREFCCEVPLLTAAGRAHWVGMRVRRLEGAGGRPSYVCAAHDLEAVHAELEVLRRRVRETAARAQEAAATARLKAEFLTVMSREIRGPMNGLIAMSRLLIASELGRDQRTWAEVIESSGRNLLTIVDDLIDFSKIEAGGLEPASIDFDLRVTADAVGAVLAQRARDRGLNFTYAVSHRVPSHVNGDPGRLRQVLVNLGDTAVHLAERGDIGLRVELAEETAHQVVLRFTITDAGWGSEPEESAALLRCFGEDRAPIPAREGSAGLGLMMSRRLVALLGGTVGLREESAGGAHALWFTLPLAKQAESAARVPLPEVSLSHLRVLVADPVKSLRAPVAEALAEWGCVVDQAEDGLDALDLLHAAADGGHPYRLALVDLDLAVLNGEELAAAVREDGTLTGTLLVMLTNLGRQGDAAQAEAWGYSAYLVKPVVSSQLREALIEVVRRGQATDDAGAGGSSAAPGGGLVTRHTVAEQRRQRTRLLIVQADTPEQVVAVEGLRRMGYAPQAAAGPDEALAQMSGPPFDLVLLDVVGRGEDACALTVAIRRCERDGRHTPVVGMIDEEQSGTRQRCLAAGMDDLLVQPLDLEAVEALVERWTQIDEPEAELLEADIVGDADPVDRTWTEQADGVSVALVPPGGSENGAGGATPPETDGLAQLTALDLAQLENSSMGSPSLEGLLVNAFTSGSHEPLIRLREAIDRGAGELVEHEAEGLMRVSKAVGAMRCAEIFRRIAELAHAGRLDALPPLTARAGIELARVEGLLGERREAA